MAKFQFLPAETKFYEWFEKATSNLRSEERRVGKECRL